MNDNTEVQSSANWRTSTMTVLALATVLVGYPAFRMIVAYFDMFPERGGVSNWWALWGVMLVGHWLCVAVVFSAIASERAGLESIGLKFGVFVRGRLLFLALLLAALGIAIYVPGYFYGDALPGQMESHPLGPVDSAQRVFWIPMAITAGFAEEVIFRGYALTRLRRFVGAPLAVAIGVASFALMHGPSAFIPQFAALYIVSGLLFSAAFLILKSRRLEMLIIAHAALDLVLIAAP